MQSYIRTPPWLQKYQIAKIIGQRESLHSNYILNNVNQINFGLQSLHIQFLSSIATPIFEGLEILVCAHERMCLSFLEFDHPYFFNDSAVTAKDLS